MGAESFSSLSDLQAGGCANAQAPRTAGLKLNVDAEQSRTEQNIGGDSAGNSIVELIKVHAVQCAVGSDDCRPTVALDCFCAVTHNGFESDGDVVVERDQLAELDVNEGRRDRGDAAR